MLEILTKEGHNIEEVVAFATDEARAKNGDKLCAELRANGYENSCRFVKIVDKVTDDKIWDLFEAVYNEINPGDTIFSTSLMDFGPSPSLFWLSSTTAVCWTV